MNFVKRAFLYCFRQKVKTLILFLVLAIISTFLLTGLAIRDASEGATDVGRILRTFKIKKNVEVTNVIKLKV